MPWGSGGGTVLVAVVVLVCCGGWSMCLAADVSVTNDLVRVGLDVPSGRLTVTDLRDGTVWTQHVPTKVAEGSQWGKVKVRPVWANQLVALTGAAADGLTISARAVWRDGSSGGRLVAGASEAVCPG